MSYLEDIVKCNHNGYFHNSGALYTTGKYCEDCNKFILKGTLEYFMTVGHSSISMAIWNRRADYHRYIKGMTSVPHEDIPLALNELILKLDDRFYMRSLSEKEALSFMDYTYKILKEYQVCDDEASILLKM